MTDRPAWVALLADAFGRTNETLRGVVSGLSAEQLAYRPAPDANPIGWIAWHVTRVQDDHLAEAGGEAQAWIAGGWHERFGLPYAQEDFGFGQSTDQVAAFTAYDPDLLIGYADAVYSDTVRILDSLGAVDLGQVVDERWDPPVTLGVRLISVVNETGQHTGQMAYIAGLLAK